MDINNLISVNQRFKNHDQLITRAPDKMITFFSDNIILAYRDNILQINLADAKVDEKDGNGKEAFIEANISEDQVNLLDLSKNFKIITIQPLSDFATIVLEEKRTR